MRARPHSKFENQTESQWTVATQIQTGPLVVIYADSVSFLPKTRERSEGRSRNGVQVAAKVRFIGCVIPHPLYDPGKFEVDTQGNL